MSFYTSTIDIRVIPFHNDDYMVEVTEDRDVEGRIRRTVKWVGHLGEEMLWPSGSPPRGSVGEDTTDENKGFHHKTEEEALRAGMAWILKWIIRKREQEKEKEREVEGIAERLG